MNLKIKNEEIKNIQKYYELGNFKKAKKMIQEINIKNLSDEEKEEVYKLKKNLSIDKAAIAIGLFVFFIPIILLIIYAGN